MKKKKRKQSERRVTSRKFRRDTTEKSIQAAEISTIVHIAAALQEFTWPICEDFAFFIRGSPPAFHNPTIA